MRGVPYFSLSKLHDSKRGDPWGQIKSLYMYTRIRGIASPARFWLLTLLLPSQWPSENNLSWVDMTCFKLNWPMFRDFWSWFFIGIHTWGLIFCSQKFHSLACNFVIWFWVELKIEPAGFVDRGREKESLGRSSSLSNWLFTELRKTVRGGLCFYLCPWKWFLEKIHLNQ